MNGNGWRKMRCGRGRNTKWVGEWKYGEIRKIWRNSGGFFFSRWIFFFPFLAADERVREWSEDPSVPVECGGNEGDDVGEWN